MANISQTTEKPANRRRKPHKKSRRGCGNCKLRGVKCDESKPECKKCAAFGVSCSYDPGSSQLQLSAKTGFSVGFSQWPSHHSSWDRPAASTIDPGINLQLSPLLGRTAGYPLESQDWDILHRFQNRTVLTIGTEDTSHFYQSEIIRLANLHPFLMHTVMVVTMMHDRYQSVSPTTQRSTDEVFHCYQGAALFNSKLSSNVQPSEMDALWSTSILLGVAAFASIEANTPEEAWPLGPPSLTDLRWLKISDGKKEVWRIANPLRDGSVYRKVASNYLEIVPDNPPTLDAVWGTLPAGFAQLYNLDSSSTVSNNPYHATAASLAALLNLECNRSTILTFLSFMNHMQPEYKRLLHQKDPRALLQLAYWFGKLCRSQQWWVTRRALLEGRAICIYLARYHSHESEILRLLDFPTGLLWACPSLPRCPAANDLDLLTRA